jgi:phosphate starvation-inducible PhoH-like protein
VPGIRFVYFDERDVVRHHLVQRIIRAYEQHAHASNGAGSSADVPSRVPTPQP